MSSQKELIPMRPEDLLRHERMQKGLSLERAARESRIRPAIIEAIESGETAHIPSVYLKGHIRNYARYLGLDPADFEEALQDVKGAEPGVRSVFNAPARPVGTEKWIKVSGYLAASVMIAALAWQFTHQAVRFSQGEARMPVASESTADGAFEQAARPAPGRSHLNASIAPVEALESPRGAPSQEAAQNAWSALENPPLPAGRHALTLETSADTWVEIYGADGRQLEMDLVRAGNSRSYADTGPFQVMIGRASAVVLVLDGETVNLAPHTQGDVARLVLAEADAGNGPAADSAEPR